jgi:hypothetical protein
MPCLITCGPGVRFNCCFSVLQRRRERHAWSPLVGANAAQVVSAVDVDTQVVVDDDSSPEMDACVSRVVPHWDCLGMGDLGMTTHIYHPRVWNPEEGFVNGPVLCDDCPRCQEHAQNPHWSLDLQHLAALRELWKNDGPWLSECDRIAAERLFLSEMGR